MVKYVWISVEKQVFYSYAMCFQVSVDSIELANVSLKGCIVYRCLATPSAAPGCLSHWMF